LFDIAGSILPRTRAWRKAGAVHFALFLNEAPGAQLYLGVANTEAGMDGSPHSPDFAADERAIAHAVHAMTGLLTHRLTALSAADDGLGPRSGDAAR
jgi:metal-dependent amidase/aminoacylase/carboxypeptidase family protein